MSYPIPPGRRRRRRGFVVLLVVAGVIAALVVAVQIRGDRRQLADYLNVARDAAGAHQSAAAVVAGVMVNLEDMERPMVLSSLEDAVAQATAANDMLAAEPAPASAARTGAFLTVAAESWLDGLTLFQGAVTALLDDPADIEGLVRLDTAFRDLAVGDRAYASFQAAVVDLNGEVETRNFPDVRYIGEAEASLYDAGLFSQRLAALKELEARYDVAVSDIRFDPEPVSDQDGVPQLPFTEGFEVQVTIANRGNEPAADVTVGIQLLKFSDLSEAELVGEDTRMIELLEPGQATTLIFDQFVVEAGMLHEVVVRAVLADDEDLSSNEVRLVFFRNEAQ